MSGTGQRELHYVYDINNNRLRTTVRTAAGDILSQSLSNGFGQSVVQTAPSTTGYIYTRSEYNAKGLLVKQYQDTGAGPPSTAPTLYEYDAMGNQVRETLSLCDTPSKDDSPVQEKAYSVEQLQDGVYSVISSTRYNAQGEPLTSTQKQQQAFNAHSIFLDTNSEILDNADREEHEYYGIMEVTAESSRIYSKAICQISAVFYCSISHIYTLGMVRP